LGNGALSWEHGSWGMELFTYPNVVLILRISRAIPLLLLCATIGMLWSDLFLTRVWLIVRELIFYISAQKKSNKHKKFEILGIYKESFLLPIQQCV
jgi:hypothetical protein